MNMKKMKHIFLLALVALSAIGFTACSDDDDNATVEPKVDILSVESYDMSELDANGYVLTAVKFSSSTPWRLYADKMWVLFARNEIGTYMNDATGLAGTHTIYIKITGDGRDFEAAEANISIAAAGKNFPVETVSRSAKKHEITITDEDGGSMESIDIDGSASVSVRISGNSQYGIKSYPEWLEEPTLHEEGYDFEVKENFTPYVLSGNIVLASADGLAEYTFPVNYAGMPGDRIEINGDYTSWAWEVSLDGKTFVNESPTVEGGTELVTLEGHIPFAIKCLNYDCQFILAEEANNGSVVVSADPWLVVERSADDESSVLVTAKTFEPSKAARSRKGYLFAVPSAIYDTFMSEIAAAADMLSLIDTHEKYVMLEITQKDIYAPEGFTVTDADGNIIPCVAETDKDLYEWVSSELGITEVYTIEGINDAKYTINTLYTEEDWGGGYNIYDSSDYANARIWSLSRKINDEGYYILSLKVPVASKFTEPVVIRLHDNNVNKKALIIKPVNN